MQRREDYPGGSRFMPGALPSSSSRDTFPHTHMHDHQHDHNPITNHYGTASDARPYQPSYHTAPQDDMMDIDTSSYYNPSTPPRSLTNQRAAASVKRAAEESVEELQAQVAQRLQPEFRQPPTRRVAGMLTIIPSQVWEFGFNAFTGLFNIFSGPAQTQAPAQPQITHIDAVETDASGRKRRAVDVTPSETSHQPQELDDDDVNPSDAPHQPQELDGDVTPSRAPRQPRELEGSSKPMLVSRPPPQVTAPEEKREEKRDTIQSSFSGVTARALKTRAKFHTEYHGSQNVAGIRPRPRPLLANSDELLRNWKDRQIGGLVDKANRAQGGSFAQKAAALEAARIEVAEKAAEDARIRAAVKQAAAEAARIEEARIEAARVEAARIEVARVEAARLEAEKEEARKTAEEEAARAQEIITELSQEINNKLQNSLNTTANNRHTIVQLGSIPLQKLTFKRILAADRGSENWLDDDAVNAWFNSIGEAKKHQTNYIKSDTTPPPFANLQTAWFNKVENEGAASLKRWMKRAGVGGGNILKCERLFLPINKNNHWTLLIINGTNKTIEYLDSLGGSPTKYFKIARDLLKAELGTKYDATKWKDSQRDRSSKQDNGSDCGVFTCFNGLAAAKDMNYKEVTAEKMPAARRMMAGILINGGFTGDFGF